MRQRTKPKRRSSKSVLRLPDLDHSKSSVLQRLGSTASKRTYGFAIDDFISWYCSEPRLAFGRTVVLHYRYELESRQLPPLPAPHDLRRTCARLCHSAGGELEQIQFLLGHRSVETTERYLGSRQRLVQAVNDHLGIEPQGGSS